MIPHQIHVPKNIPKTSPRPCTVEAISPIENMENANINVIIVAGFVIAIIKDDAKKEIICEVLAVSFTTLKL